MLPLLSALCLICCKRDKEAEFRQALNTAPVLYTAEAKAKVFVESTDEPSSLMRHFGQRTIIIPVSANVKAGIDISEIKAVRAEGNTVYITLPEPFIEIESTHIDYGGIASSVTGMRDNFTESEITALAAEGRDKIVEKLPELGLVEPAILQAEQSIRSIASSLGLEVVFDVKTDYTPKELKELLR